LATALTLATAQVSALTPDFSEPIACCVAGASIQATALFTA
jgi:hypothetical protein